MNEDEEHKLLRQILAAIDETTPRKWSWQAFATTAISFCTLTVAALWLFDSCKINNASLAACLIGTLLAGAMIGALSTWKFLCKNSAVVRQYIDTERVRARLSELDP